MAPAPANDSANDRYRSSADIGESKHRSRLLTMLGGRRQLASFTGFGGKAAGALALNYYLANFLSTGDFAAWSRLISLFVIISVSDLGIGQYVMTTLMSHPTVDREGLLRRSVALLSALAVLAACVLYVLLNGIVEQSTTLLIAVVAPRLVFIPFGAALSAMGRFHERKLAEGIMYIVAVGTAVVSGGRTPDLQITLVVVNAALSLAGGVIYIRYLCLRDRLPKESTSGRGMQEILSGSGPYFVNNLSSLLLYGGFIWFMGIFLPPIELAKLSILHVLIFVNGYQLADVFLRTHQVDFIKRHYFLRIERGCFALAAGFIAAGAVIGPWALIWYTKKYSFTTAEICVYMLFSCVEIYWLLIQLQMQVEPAKASMLARSSIWKCVITAIMVFMISRFPKFQDLCSSLLLFAAASLTLLLCYRADLFKVDSVEPALEG